MLIELLVGYAVLHYSGFAAYDLYKRKDFIKNDVYELVSLTKTTDTFDNLLVFDGEKLKVETDYNYYLKVITPYGRTKNIQISEEGAKEISKKGMYDSELRLNMKYIDLKQFILSGMIKRLENMTAK